MSVQWMVVSSFLYSEIVLCILLCLPFIQPKRWQYLFKSRLLALFVSYGNLCLVVSVSILVLFLVDAVREVRKYSLSDYREVDLKNNPSAQDHVLMKLFRAQRNLYITFFALFLLIIIWRLTRLLSQQATLLATNEAIKRQAESASRAAEAMLDKNVDKDDSKKKGAKDENNGKYDDDAVKELQVNLDHAREAEETAKNDLTAMKAQAKALTNEYDRLLEEHAKLQKKVEQDGDKKDD